MLYHVEHGGGAARGDTGDELYLCGAVGHAGYFLGGAGRTHHLGGAGGFGIDPLRGLCGGTGVPDRFPEEDILTSRVVNPMPVQHYRADFINNRFFCQVPRISSRRAVDNVC